MLRYAVVFLVIALMAALLGFTSVPDGVVGFAKNLFFGLLLLFVAWLVIGLRGRR